MLFFFFENLVMINMLAIRDTLGCGAYQSSISTEEKYLSYPLKWRRKWQLTPVFLPRESCGQRSLVGCCPWGRTELDTTEVT